MNWTIVLIIVLLGLGIFTLFVNAKGIKVHKGRIYTRRNFYKFDQIAPIDAMIDPSSRQVVFLPMRIPTKEQLEEEPIDYEDLTEEQKRTFQVRR